MYDAHRLVHAGMLIPRHKKFTNFCPKGVPIDTTGATATHLRLLVLNNCLQLFYGVNTLSPVFVGAYYDFAHTVRCIATYVPQPC